MFAFNRRISAYNLPKILCYLQGQTQASSIHCLWAFTIPSRDPGLWIDFSGLRKGNLNFHRKMTPFYSSGHFPEAPALVAR
jgi:hypothetical protein